MAQAKGKGFLHKSCFKRKQEEFKEMEPEQRKEARQKWKENRKEMV